MNGRAARMLPYLLSFFSSFCIMILELVASRLVARHVGASLTVWTSVIGIMLGGICLGNVLGGRLADRIEPGRAVGPLYALGAVLTLSCLWMNAVVGLFPGLDRMAWDLRTVVVVVLDFLVPGTVLGMIGPVVAKMAVEQAKKSGSAIGDVYFMGAVGSIVGTFFAGFVLMALLPVSAIVALVAAALALLAALLIGNPAAQG
jgi:MFS family permease